MITDGMLPKSEAQRVSADSANFRTQHIIWRLRNAGSKGNIFRMKTFNGHFDGKVIVLDEPADLQPNTKVKIIAPAADDSSGLSTDFAILSEPVFKKIWDNPLDADYDAL
jgi:hypothetical protein